MSFHLGKPVLVMLVISAISGGAIWLRPPPLVQPMNVWVFADVHARVLRDPGRNGGPSLVEQYRQQTGTAVGVHLISNRALDVRLISLFNNQSAHVPDLVEVEINSVGKFFRPPLREVGFLPLNTYLERDGIMDKIVRNRLVVWSKGDTIFGIPHDVHPVTISYRKDIFDAAGVDLASARTWDQFQEKCLQFQAHYRKKGLAGRWAMEMPSASADLLNNMLLQRHINVIDNNNRVHISDPKVANTISRYALMVAGARRIGADTTPGGDLWVRDLVNGDIGAVLTADWRATFLRNLAGVSLQGKMSMMPLPRFDADDAPTSTWGGTMIAIPRHCKDPEASWQLLKFLYLSPQSLGALQQHSDIIPPFKDHWRSPAYHQPDPFYGNMVTGDLFVQLAEQIPSQHVTPFTLAGLQTLAWVLNRTVQRAATQGSQGLEAACQTWCDLAAEDLQRRIEFGTFE